MEAWAWPEEKVELCCLVLLRAWAKPLAGTPAWRTTPSGFYFWTQPNPPPASAVRKYSKQFSFSALLRDQSLPTVVIICLYMAVVVSRAYPTKNSVLSRLEKVSGHCHSRFEHPRLTARSVLPPVLI